MLPLSCLLGRGLDVEIFEPVTVQHHHAGFFRVGGIDQHALGHLVLNSGAPPGLRRDPGGARIGGRRNRRGGRGWPAAQGSEHGRPNAGALSSARADGGCRDRGLAWRRSMIGDGHRSLACGPTRSVASAAPVKQSCRAARSRSAGPRRADGAARAMTRQRRDVRRSRGPHAAERAVQPDGAVAPPDPVPAAARPLVQARHRSGRTMKQTGRAASDVDR